MADQGAAGGSATIVFDGACILCSASARFVLRHDRQRRFRLLPMQGEAGAELMRGYGIDPAEPETMIVVDRGAALRDSDAVLAIARGLGWPWRAAGIFRLVPRRLRDGAYRWLARNRYRLFGRSDRCVWIPPDDGAGTA